MKVFRSSAGLLIILLLCFNEFACASQGKHPKVGRSTPRINGSFFNKIASTRKLEDTESIFEIIFYIEEANHELTIFQTKDTNFPDDGAYLIYKGQIITDFGINKDSTDIYFVYTFPDTGWIKVELVITSKISSLSYLFFYSEAKRIMIKKLATPGDEFNSLDYMFSDTTVRFIGGLDKIDVTKTTKMDSMFYSSENCEIYQGTSTWNPSQVSSTWAMFSTAKQAKIINIPFNSVSSTTNMFNNAVVSCYFDAGALSNKLLNPPSNNNKYYSFHETASESSECQESLDLEFKAKCEEEGMEFVKNEDEYYQACFVKFPQYPDPRNLNPPEDKPKPTQKPIQKKKKYSSQCKKIKTAASCLSFYSCAWKKGKCIQKFFLENSKLEYCQITLPKSFRNYSPKKFKEELRKLRKRGGIKVPKGKEPCNKNDEVKYHFKKK